LSDNFWDEVVGKDLKKEKKEESKLTSQQPTTSESKPIVDDPFSSSQTEQKPQETPKPQTQPVEKAEDTPIVESPPNNNPSSSSPPTDPFAEKTEETVATPTPKSPPFSTGVEEATQSSAPSPPSDPFGGKQPSLEDEFAKQKPSSSGKNLSSMIYGKKGTGKTLTALSLPGKIFAISLDQQTAIIHEDFYNKDPRIEVWDGIEFFNSKDPETKLESAVKTVEYINWLLENPCKKFQPDWILFDGTERLSHVCEMAMRAQEKLLPYEGVKNRNAWKYRNDLINNFVQRATQIARLGVVYTAFTEIETVTTAMEEEKREGPKWAGDIEQKTQIVIKTTSTQIQNGRAFIAEVESSKVSCIPTGRKVVTGERMNSGEIQNFFGIKALFTPEGHKKYFSSGGE